MKILFYDTKSYDREFFEKLLPSYPGIEIKFIEANIHEETAALAHGYDAICAFVNADLGAPAVSYTHLIIPYNDKTLYIPTGCHIYHIIDPFTANEHNIIASVFCFDLQRSGNLSHKRILQRLHTMNEGKTKNHSNDP